MSRSLSALLLAVLLTSCTYGPFPKPPPQPEPPSPWDDPPADGAKSSPHPAGK